MIRGCVLLLFTIVLGACQSPQSDPFIHEGTELLSQLPDGQWVTCYSGGVAMYSEAPSMGVPAFAGDNIVIDRTEFDRLQKRLAMQTELIEALRKKVRLLEDHSQ